MVVFALALVFVCLWLSVCDRVFVAVLVLVCLLLCVFVIACCDCVFVVVCLWFCVWHLRLWSSSAHCDLALAVEVR